MNITEYRLVITSEIAGEDGVRENDYDYDQLLSLAEFRMLSRLDLGDKWGKYADTAPVLFVLPEDTTMDVRIRRPYGIRYA